MEPGGEQPGPSRRQEGQESELSLEGERIGAGDKNERIIYDESPSDDEDEGMLVIDVDAEEKDEVRFVKPQVIERSKEVKILNPKLQAEPSKAQESVQKASEEAMETENLQPQKASASETEKGPQEPSENQKPRYPSTSSNEGMPAPPFRTPGRPPMRWGVAVDPNRAHLYTLRPIAPPPPGAQPGEYLTEGFTYINPPQTRANTKFRRAIRRALANKKTIGLVQVRSSASRRAFREGIYRMKRSAGNVAMSFDLRVATCREVTSLHVTSLEAGEIEPDWDTLWETAESADSSFENLPPGKVMKPIEGSTASESASTPSPSPELAALHVEEAEEDEDVDILSTSIEANLNLVGELPEATVAPEAPVVQVVAPTVEEEEDIEVDVVSVDDDDETNASIWLQQSQIPAEVEKEAEFVKAQPLSSDPICPRRPGARSAILISVDEAPPPPPTRGRPRKRSKPNNLGSRPVPIGTASSVETPGKRRYRRKNASQELLPICDPVVVPSETLPQPIARAPRGRKRKTIDVPILPVPEKEPRPLKSRRKTSAGLQNLPTSSHSGGCKLTIKFGQDMGHLASEERLEASEAPVASGSQEGTSRIGRSASRMKSIPPPESLATPSKLLEFMENITKQMQGTPQLEPATQLAPPTSSAPQPSSTPQAPSVAQLEDLSKFQTPAKIYKKPKAVAAVQKVPASLLEAYGGSHSHHHLETTEPSKLLKSLLEPPQPQQANEVQMTPAKLLKTSHPEQAREVIQMTPATVMKLSTAEKVHQPMKKTSARLLEPPRPEKIVQKHMPEATVSQLLEELSFPSSKMNLEVRQPVVAMLEVQEPVEFQKAAQPSVEVQKPVEVTAEVQKPAQPPVEVQEPVKPKRGRKKRQDMVATPVQIEDQFVRPTVPVRFEGTTQSQSATTQGTTQLGTTQSAPSQSATSQSPTRPRRARMMHPEPSQDVAFNLIMEAISPRKPKNPQEGPQEPEMTLEQKIRLARLQELTSVAQEVLTEPQPQQQIQKTPRKSRKAPEPSQEAEASTPRRTRRTPSKPAESIEEASLSRPIRERKSRQKRHPEAMEVDPPAEVAMETEKNPVENEMPSSQHPSAADPSVTFEEPPTTSRGRRGKKEHIQPRTSSRPKKAEKRPESPLPIELLRKISLMEKGSDAGDDDVSTISEDLNYQKATMSVFSTPPVQYQFSPGKKIRPPVIDLDNDNDITILSPPREEEDDEIQVISQRGAGILMGPVKIEEEEEEVVVAEPRPITDLEYDEDGVDDPPLGGALIDACDYLQLDADNEICEDYMPFPPDKIRVDPGVFVHYVRCLAAGYSNIVLLRPFYPFMHYSTDFSTFLENLNQPRLAELEIDEPDPQARVNEAFCCMSIQATQLLTRDPLNKKKLITSNKFKEMIKMFLTRNNELKELAFPLFEDEEENHGTELKEAWKQLERNILLRLCDSLLSLVKETNSWTNNVVTDNVFRRRFEAMLIGWRNFFMRGGPLKFFFNTVFPDIDAPSLNRTFEDWIARHDVIIENIKKALDLGAEKRTTALMVEMEAAGKKMRWRECREDVGTEETERHRFKCKACEVYFTKKELLDAHAQVHNYKPHSCEICYLDFTYKTSLYIHFLHRHFKEILLGEITA